MNIYDVRLDDEAPACGMNWPPDLKDIGTYLHVRCSLPQRFAVYLSLTIPLYFSAGMSFVPFMLSIPPIHGLSAVALSTPILMPNTVTLLSRLYLVF